MKLGVILVCRTAPLRMLLVHRVRIDNSFGDGLDAYRAGLRSLPCPMKLVGVVSFQVARAGHCDFERLSTVERVHEGLEIC